MSIGQLIWLVFRIGKWAAWVSFFAYTVAVVLDRPSYVSMYGLLLRSTEVWLFGLPVLAVTLGFLELMMRERAGIARPNYFRLMPPTSN